jgi:hypothetical protein
MTITNPLFTNSMMAAGIAPGAGAPSPQPPMQQGNALMPQGQPVPQKPQMSPQQVQQAHEHISDTLQEFDKLLKLPDEDLTLGKVFGAAADLINKYKLSNHKRGADPLTVAKELSDPSFPREGENGEPPPPQAIRKFIQNHFDKHILTQANLTAMFGGPQMQSPAQMPQAQPNNQLMGAP